jgi:hypothetical protein
MACYSLRLLTIAIASIDMETPVSAGRVADILLVPRARLSCGAGWVVEEVHVETLGVGDAREGGEDRKNSEELHLGDKREI